MVRRHQLERFGADDLLALEFAAVEDHLREFRKIRHCRDHAASAGFPFRDNIGVTQETDPEVAVLWHRLGDQLLLVGISDIERGIAHAQRTEQIVLFILQQRFPRGDLDDTAEDVGRMAVIP